MLSRRRLRLYVHATVLPAGDLRLADTLGSPAKSNRENKTLTSPGWKAHGESTQSHHYLCRYRLDPYALDVAASAGDRPGDRRCRDRRGRGRRGDRASACAQSAGRPARSVAGGLRAVPQGDQAALQRGGEHHHRRRADHDGRGARQAGRDLQAGGRLAQHGHDEFRAVSDDPALQGQVQTRLGGAVSGRLAQGHVQEHFRRHRIHPHHLRGKQHALRDRVLRHRPSLYAASISSTAAWSSRRCSCSRCSAFSAASARIPKTSS